MSVLHSGHTLERLRAFGSNRERPDHVFVGEHVFAGRLVEPILPIPAVILTSWLGPFTPNCGRWTKTPWSIRATVH